MMLLQSFDTTIDVDAVLAAVVPTKRERYAPVAADVYASLSEVVRPVALFVPCRARPVSGDTYELCGVPFSSPLFSLCFSRTDTAYPFVFSLGEGVDTVIRSHERPVPLVLADTMANAMLLRVRESFEQRLCSMYHHGHVAMVRPGSLDVWPLSGQGPLFSVLSRSFHVPVRLTDQYLMDPMKSISGIYFPTVSPVSPCMLCTAEHCIGREHAYDPELFTSIVGGPSVPKKI